jgi:hypothetical protein
MNIYLLASSLVLAFTAVMHSIAGERSIIGPLQKSDTLPKVGGSMRFTKNTLRLAWHVTSLLGLGIAAVLFYYATFTIINADQKMVLKIMTVTFTLCFMLSLLGSRGKHPAWIAFLIASLLTGWVCYFQITPAS